MARLQGGSAFHSTRLLTPGLSKTPDPCPHLLAVLAQTSPASAPGAALTQAPGRCGALNLSLRPGAARESARAHRTGGRRACLAAF